MRNYDRRKVVKKFGRGKDSVEIDLTKVKMVNEDAIKRSEYHNKIVDKIEFISPSGRFCFVSGNQLLYFTLTPTKPLIDCHYIKLVKTVETIDNAKNKNDIYFIRACSLNKKEGEIFDNCHMTNQKIADKKCVGKKFQTSSLEFWIITNGFIQDEDNEKEFKIGFFNKIANGFIKEEFRDNGDNLKTKSLYNLYNAIKTGSIKVISIPKPGNTLFHTIFSGIVKIDIETITGDNLKGTVKGYEFSPGGYPSLNIYIEDKLRIVPLYIIATMIIEKYEVNDILSRRAIELTMKGHIVIPHRGNNVIYDYCNRYKTDKDQEIKLDGTMIPFNQFDKHDIEIKNIIRNIN